MKPYHLFSKLSLMLFLLPGKYVAGQTLHNTPAVVGEYIYNPPMMKGVEVCSVFIRNFVQHPTETYVLQKVEKYFPGGRLMKRSFFETQADRPADLLFNCLYVYDSLGGIKMEYTANPDGSERKKITHSYQRDASGHVEVIKVKTQYGITTDSISWLPDSSFAVNSWEENKLKSITTYNPTGRRISVINFESGYYYEWTYDPHQNILHWDDKPLDEKSKDQKVYRTLHTNTYDSAGNLTELRINGVLKEKRTYYTNGFLYELSEYFGPGETIFCTRKYHYIFTSK